MPENIKNDSIVKRLLHDHMLVHSMITNLQTSHQQLADNLSQNKHSRLVTMNEAVINVMDANYKVLKQWESVLNVDENHLPPRYQQMTEQQDDQIQPMLEYLEGIIIDHDVLVCQRQLAELSIRTKLDDIININMRTYINYAYVIEAILAEYGKTQGV